MPASDRQIVAVPVVCIRIVGIECQRALELLLSSRPIPLMVKHQSQRRVGFGRLRVDGNGLTRRRKGPWKSFRGGREAVPGEPAVAIGKTGISGGEVRIVVDRP